jgi:hypothetical protein
LRDELPELITKTDFDGAIACLCTLALGCSFCPLPADVFISQQASKPRLDQVEESVDGWMDGWMDEKRNEITAARTLGNGSIRWWRELGWMESHHTSDVEMRVTPTLCKVLILYATHKRCVVIKTRSGT